MQTWNGDREKKRRVTTVVETRQEALIPTTPLAPKSQTEIGKTTRFYVPPCCPTIEVGHQSTRGLFWSLWDRSFVVILPLIRIDLEEDVTIEYLQAFRHNFLLRHK